MRKNTTKAAEQNTKSIADYSKSLDAMSEQEQKAEMISRINCMLETAPLKTIAFIYELCIRIMR